MEVLLREVEPGDLPSFFEYQSDAGASRLAAVPSRDRDTFEAHWQRILADESSTIRTIVADGAVAGHLVAFPRDGVVEVGYWLGREHWGKGIATKALGAFLREVAHRPLHAAAARHNPGSIRVLEKCGFAATGYATEQDPSGGEVEMAHFRLD